MQGEQPGKEGETQARRQQQPGAPPLGQPQVGQIAADDLGQRGDQEQPDRFELQHHGSLARV